MKAFTVYNKRTGDILRSGRCRDEDFELQATNATEAVIEGEGHDVLDRVVIPSKGSAYLRSRGASVAAQFASSEGTRRQLIDTQMQAMRANAALAKRN